MSPSANVRISELDTVDTCSPDTVDRVQHEEDTYSDGDRYPSVVFPHDEGLLNCEDAMELTFADARNYRDSNER